MKSLWTPTIFFLAAASLAIAAPIGICLHAYSPEAPANKIECFEFESSERFGADYRFFIDANKPAVVTGYRYRGAIAYRTGLAPGNPEFDKLLKLYEETSRATPATRRYLNPKILAMRAQSAAYLAEQQRTESLPKINFGGVVYLSPQFKAIEDGKLVVAHKDGVVKIETEKISDPELQALAKIDPKAAKIKVLEIAKNRLWNPSFDSISSMTVKIKHENGILPLRSDTLTEKDHKTIMSWSDGTWKIGKPGFYKPKSGDGSYGELILENGRFHNDVKLTNRVGEAIALKTSKAGIKLPIRDLAIIPGITAPDSAKIDTWATEIVDERLSRATPEAYTKVISTVDAEVLTVTGVRVKILQVLDQGVLASKFIGKLHKGTEKVQTTHTKTVEHPVTGMKISKVVDSSVDDFEVTEDVTDDLCYIVGNTNRLVDGEIVTADSMKLLGRYQYTDVRGAQRSVRKYHVD